MTETEQQAWDLYLAHAVSGILAANPMVDGQDRTAILASAAAKLADLMLAERRNR